MRVRWFEPDDPSTPIEWRMAAAILAPLFLNFLFWLAVADRFRLFRPLPLFALVTAGVALVATAISVAPWLSVSAVKPLPRVLADSFGEGPAQVLRWICAAFALAWLASAVSLPVRLWSYRDETVWHSYGVGAVLLVLLSFTGLQGAATGAKLGLFTSKLGVALLVAAMWRVRDGLPEIPASLDGLDGDSLWRGFTDLAAYIIPFGLLAADVPARMRSGKDAALAATSGILIPLLVVLLLAAVIGQAAWRSYVYQASLNPTVDMALYGKVASSALPGRWAIGAITVFGVARFCVRSISVGLPLNVPKWPAWILLCAAACWLSLHPFVPGVEGAMKFLANCLGVVSAIITADWLIRHRATSRRINFIGCAVLSVGLLAMRIPHDPWHSWLLPCYAVAFVACLVGRIIERAIR